MLDSFIRTVEYKFHDREKVQKVYKMANLQNENATYSEP